MMQSRILVAHRTIVKQNGKQKSDAFGSHRLALMIRFEIDEFMRSSTLAC